MQVSWEGGLRERAWGGGGVVGFRAHLPGSIKTSSTSITAFPSARRWLCCGTRAEVGRVAAFSGSQESAESGRTSGQSPRPLRAHGEHLERFGRFLEADEATAVVAPKADAPADILVGDLCRSPFRSIALNKQGHRRTGEVVLRARHQEEPIDGIVLDAAGGPKARYPHFRQAHPRLLCGRYR
jgi:hypothetical protein